MKSDPFAEAPVRKKQEDKRKGKGDTPPKKTSEKRKPSQDPEGDLQAKLDMLKNKFGKS